MKYLFIFEDNEFWTGDKIEDVDIVNSEDGILTIINLEDLTFHVEGQSWQQIPPEVVYNKGKEYYIIERTESGLVRLQDVTNPTVTKLVESKTVLTLEQFEELKLKRPFGFINYTV